MPDLWKTPGYDVLELLGFGGTGEVWRARETATGDTVALKRLRPGVDPAALRREAGLLRLLDTPYVVRLRAVLGEGEDTVLVLDHAEGGSLASLLLARGRLGPGEVVTIALPLAEALAAAHAKGLVHGDVTPSNVLFTAEGMPLLSDLGLARVLPRAGAAERAQREDRTRSAPVVAAAGAPGPGAAVDGTAEYVDPAVAAGGDPTPASDVWALAAVCHHLLAGTPPHDGATADDVLGAAAAGERAPLGLLAPLVPRPLVVAVEQALVADPDARPDATTFAAALRRAHSAQPVQLLTGRSPDVAADPVRATHRVREAATPSAHALPRRPLVPRATGLLRQLPRPALLAGGAVLALVAAAAVGWRTGSDGAAASPTALAPAVAAGRTPGTSAPGGTEQPPGVVEGASPVAGSAAPSGGASGATSTRSPGGLPVPAGGATGATAGGTTGAPGTTTGGTEGATGAASAPGTARWGPAVVPVDWGAVLDRLDAARSAAFASGDVGGLEAACAPGSPALRRDAEALGRLAEQGRTAVGVRHTLRAVHQVALEGARARLRVRDVLAPYRVLDADGAVLARLPARGERTFDVVLVRTRAGYRLEQVTGA